MKPRTTMIRTLSAAAALLLSWGCHVTPLQPPNGHDSATDPGDTGDDEGEAACTPSPDFTLTDLNPNSPTFETARSVSDQEGKVLLIYFALYS